MELFACLAGLFVVGVTVLLYRISARRLDGQGIVMHSSTVPFLGITSDLINIVAKKGNGIMLWHYMLEEHKKTSWATLGWSRLGGDEMVQLVDPRDAKYMLNDNWTNFCKTAEQGDLLAPLLGSGSLIIVEGDEWRQKRQILLHMFTKRVLRERMSEVIGQKSQVLTEGLLRNGAGDKAFDIQAVLQSYAFETMNSVVFRSDIQALRNIQPLRDVPIEVEFQNVVDSLGKHIMQRFVSPTWKIEAALQLTEAERQYTKNLDRLNSIIDAVVDDYVNDDGTINQTSRGDGTLCGMLFEHMPLEDMADPRKELRDFILTILVGGRDPTVSALTSTIMELCRHPEWQQRLHDEALELFGGELLRPLMLDDIDGRCPVAEAVFREVLRVHPPFAVLMREVVSDCTMPSGITVKQGQRMLYSPHNMHRHPLAVGDDAEEFKPERWMGDTIPIDPMFTFNYGPRSCMGRPMAMLQGKLALLTMMSRMRFRLADGFTPVVTDGTSITYEKMMVHVESWDAQK